ncbi:MAG: response regulator [Candidatus Margulisiibacteriota bacterium]
MAKILLMDDEPEFVEMLSLRLRKTGGYEVITAFDGEEGLKAAQANRPDLIILDLMMPKMDGRKVIEELKKSDQTRGIPVIVLSASASPKTAEELLKLGGFDFIVKPFEPPTLMAKIKAALEKKNAR